MRPLLPSALAFATIALIAGCHESMTPGDDASSGLDGGGPQVDSAVPADAPPPDAPPPPDGGPGEDGGAPCGGACPPELCVGGVCRDVFCCEGTPCPSGSVCDWDFSCGCVPATGCCAGETCDAGEVCGTDCTCFDPTDCRRWGFCEEPGTICDDATGDCVPDTSCGDCGADRICARGTCIHRCVFDGACPEGTICSETEGCVAPRCTDTECALFDPPQRCNPSVGCSDPCLEPGVDWSWCTAMGGRCYMGSCIDDGCSANAGVGCNYQVDCCGNHVCQRDDEPAPPCGGCDPSFPPYTPPRLELCRCNAGFAGCIDVWMGGGFPGPFPGPRPGPEPFPID